MVVHSFHTSTWEAEVGRSRLVQDQPGPHSEFQGSQGYRERDSDSKINTDHCSLM